MKTAFAAMLALATFAAALPASATTFKVADQGMARHTRTAPPHFDAGKFFEQLARNVG